MLDPAASAAFTYDWGWGKYDSGERVYLAEVFDEINRQRGLAGVPPVLYNTRLAAIAEASAEARNDKGEAHSAIEAPEGGSRVAQGYSRQEFFEDDVENVSTSPDLRKVFLDPRITHMGIGFSTGAHQVEWGEGEYTRWNETFVIEFWEYPHGTRVPGSSLSPHFHAPDSYTPPGTSPFSDVRTTQKYYREMAWLRHYGVSTGWTDRTYRPLRPISRDAMAAFLYRLAGEPPYTAPGISPFTDVSTTQKYYKEMAWLADQGISTGWEQEGGSRTYRPLRPISRDAMAAFLYRLQPLL